jgi:hypothetical protein
MVARSAPPLQISADFSQKLQARLAAERQRQASVQIPAHGGWWASVAGDWRSRTPMVRAAAVLVMLAGGGAVLASRSTARGAVAQAGATIEAYVVPAASTPAMRSGDVVVVRRATPITGLIPDARDPLGNTADVDLSVTAVSATAPLWPTARMASRAAGRFAVMEFNDITPVSTAAQR